MAARPAAHADVKSTSQADAAWTQQFLRYALLFAGLMLLHAPLLRLPYFWDEAGYYIPVARDLYLTGSPIPQSTLSNAHPPLVMAWLALAWRLFGYSTLVTRNAMLALAAFSLLGLFRLARAAANLEIALAVTALTALYPVFFTQSAMALVDLPAAGFTFWALACYLEDRSWGTVLWFSLAATTKETAVVAPLALLSWELLAPVVRSWRAALAPPLERRTRAIHLILPLLPLACWFAFHRAKTGYVFGNPDFFRYNVAGTLNPLRIPIALGLRLWQVIGYFGLWLLSLAVVLAISRPPQIENGRPRQRIEIWQQAAFAAVILAYLVFMSVVGGAALARYLLPVTPLVVLMSVATLARRLRYWKLIVAAVVVAFAGGLFTNPPYGFSVEDNLAYGDFVMMHSEASNFLAMRYPEATVLTAWPASDELARPWLGYVARPFRVVRIEDFTAAQIDVANVARNEFDVALVFSTKYQPPHELLANWAAWQRIKERFFGYHWDLPPEEIARRLGGRIVFHKERNGLWVAVIALDKAQDAQLRLPNDYPPSR
jgi:Dolichyl-phosphate-mannose-protein mannosyltransferase